MSSDVHLNVRTFRDSHIVPVKEEEMSELEKLYLSADNLLILWSGCNQAVIP